MASILEKDKKIIERALKIVKREFDQVEYIRFLSAISARRGDAAKELRKLRNVITKEELDKALKMRGAKFV